MKILRNLSRRKLALLAIIFSSLLWATAGVSAKLLLTVFDPFPLAFWRFFFASLILAPLAIRLPHPPLKLMIRDIGPIALLSVGNVAIFYLALTRTTANAAAIIYTATPLLSTLFAIRFLNERLTQRKILGICVGLIGVIVILLLPLWEHGKQLSGDTLGNILVFCAALCWAGYTVGSRRLTGEKQYSPIIVSAVSIVISCLIFLIISIIMPHRNFLLPLFNPIHLILVLHLALLVTVITYLLYQWSIKHTSTATAALTNYIQPIFSVFLGILILGEPFTIGFFVGSAIVFSGLFIYTSYLTIPLLKRLISN